MRAGNFDRAGFGMNDVDEHFAGSGDVRIRDKDLRHGRMLEVRVHPEDVGKVIGRQGRTASALRTVVQALAGRESVRIDFIDVDRKPGRGRR